MESMIDGGLKRGGPAPLFLAVNSTICAPPHIMWIRTCRLFNSSFERRVDRGESSGGWGFEGRDWQGVCAVPSRDVPCGTVPGCAVGRRDRASAVD